MAEQLRSGKHEYARIRVEGVIREGLLMQAYEILELYLELLTVRTQLMSKTKEIPRCVKRLPEAHCISCFMGSIRCSTLYMPWTMAWAMRRPAYEQNTFAWMHRHLRCQTAG